MSDIEKITIEGLDVTEDALNSDKLVVSAGDGRTKAITKGNFLKGETNERILNDAALQLQITTLAGPSSSAPDAPPRVVEKMDASLKGVAGGVAELDDSGHVPASQLPSYVDDVINGYYCKADGKFYNEYVPSSVTHQVWSDGTTLLNSDLTIASRPQGDLGEENRVATARKYQSAYYVFNNGDWFVITALTTTSAVTSDTPVSDESVINALRNADDLIIDYTPYVEDTGTYSDEITPETGKIYADIRTNLTYRYSGSAYVILGTDLALGTTSSTAFRGDRGKIAFDHSQVRGTGIQTDNNPHGIAPLDIGLGNVPNVTTNDQTPTYTVVKHSQQRLVRLLRQ